MLFNSIDFIIFLPIVLLVYYLIPERYSRLWLLLSSYFFYMCWNAKYGLLIFFCTFITYLFSHLLSKVNNKKALLSAGLLINLLILGYFKYFNMGIDILNMLFRLIRIDVNLQVLDIVLPVGISFFTFQALGYLIDVYRGDIEAERDFVKYALFVSFFPQLVAGPIERSSHLLCQFDRRKPFRFNNFQKGLLIMLWGFFVKLVIADRIAIYVNAIWNDIEIYSGFYLVIASLLFALQIYCDFYGYSLIAMGTARLIDIELMDNFKAPYLSASIGEFWDRWHISLMNWFRDYIYIPLGGNRKGRIRQYLNILIVFLISGLWHGSRITFVIWGLFNGLGSIVGKSTSALRQRIQCRIGIKSLSLGMRALQIIGVILFESFTFTIFRAPGTRICIRYFQKMISSFNPWILWDGSLPNVGLNIQGIIVLLLAIFMLLVADICKTRQVSISEIIICQNSYIQAAIIAFSICIILTFGIWGPAFDGGSFIYFQF